MKKSEVKSNKIKQKVTKNAPKKDIRDLYDIIVDTTKNAFRRVGGICPQVLIISKEKKFIVAELNGCNDIDERCDVLKIIAKKLSKNKEIIEATISITEAWLSITEERSNIMPSRDPNKKEVLIFTAMDGIGNHTNTIYEIKREKDSLDLVNFNGFLESGVWIKDGENNIDIENNLLSSFWNTYKTEIYT